jgi:hypothetical protein
MMHHEGFETQPRSLHDRYSTAAAVGSEQRHLIIAWNQPWIEKMLHNRDDAWRKRLEQRNTVSQECFH